MPRVKIESGRLAFESRLSFDRLFELSQRQRTDFIDKLEASPAFTSFRERKSSGAASNQRIINGCDVPDSLIEDNADFFATLDGNGVIQIGSDLFRVDYCNAKVFVILASIAHQGSNYTDFLNGNTSNPNVGWFHTHVDVQEAVAQGYRTMPDTTKISDPEGIFSQSKSGALGTSKPERKLINDHDLEVSPINRLMDGKLAYDKWGIYFHFYGKEKYKYYSILGGWFTASTGSQGTTSWNVGYTYSYLRKGNGQSLQTGSGDLLPPPIGNENKVDKTFYSGSRGLKDGYAQWDVWNNRTDFVRVERLGFIFQNIRPTPQAMPNYDLDTYPPSKYYILVW